MMCTANHTGIGIYKRLNGYSNILTKSVIMYGNRVL